MKQYIGLVVLFVVALIGFNAYEMHKRGLLLPLFQEQTAQLEEITVTAQPIIIAEAPQKVNSEDLERNRRNQEILATAEHNERVLGAAEQAELVRQLQRPAQLTYEVQEGDSLWSIAQNLTGDGENWHEIYEQNPDIGENPDLIFPGQVLTLDGLDMSFSGVR
jgi:nucleoid-associated protein YgaU